MSAVWKYNLLLSKSSLILPKGAELLTVQHQNDIPRLWARVDPLAPLESRHIRIIETGEEFNEPSATHISTWQHGPYVWHAFEVGISE